MDKSLMVAVADVGGSDNFGWAIVQQETLTTGSDIEAFATPLGDWLLSGGRVALASRHPSTFPVAERADEIGRAREGEWVVVSDPPGTERRASRPWSVSSGASTLALALQETLLVLSAIRSSVGAAVPVGYDLDESEEGDIRLLVWEAFLSGTVANAEAAELMRITPLILATSSRCGAHR